MLERRGQFLLELDVQIRKADAGGWESLRRGPRCCRRFRVSPAPVSQQQASQPRPVGRRYGRPLCYKCDAEQHRVRIHAWHRNRREQSDADVRWRHQQQAPTGVVLRIVA